MSMSFSPRSKFESMKDLAMIIQVRLTKADFEAIPSVAFAVNGFIVTMNFMYIVETSMNAVIFARVKLKAANNHIT